MIFFVHQNFPGNIHGGVERYIQNLLEYAGSSRAKAITEDQKIEDSQYIFIPVSKWKNIPKWIPFILSAFLNIRRLRRSLKGEDNVIEFSRPEYWPIAMILPGRRVFTFHGTGPEFESRMVKFFHLISCWPACLIADRIFVVGRDAKAIPRPLHILVSKRINFIDAWYGEPFSLQEYSIGTEIKIVYAGRLAPQKNPELLFVFLRELQSRDDLAFSFTYCGSDGERFPDDIRNWRNFIDKGPLRREELKEEIAKSDMSILLSRGGEGSPFIIPEVLACGRGFVLPPLAGLMRRYNGQAGVVFSNSWVVEDFVKAVVKLKSELSRPGASVSVAEAISSHSQAKAAEHHISALDF